MKRRTTIEIDDELLARAMRALDATTMRAAVEEALRRVADTQPGDVEDRAARQRAFLRRLPRHVDATVLAGEEMWR